MKKILTLLFLGACFIQAQAQVLFYQDFESGVIDPMTAVDVDGKTVHPNVSAIAGPTWTIIQSTADNKQVVSTSWFNPVGVADDWLISPALEITQSNTFLVWDAYSPDAAYRDGYQVRVSTTDSAIASFADILLTVPAELTTKQTRALSLDAYIGDTIYFAFRNNSNDKFLLYMDNIRVETFRNVNAIVKSVSFEKYNPVSTLVPIKVTVENHGANVLNSLVFNWSTGGNTYSDTITGLNLATLSQRELTHTVNFDVTDPGEFPVDITITYPNEVDDEDPVDNGGARKIYGMNVQLPKKVLVEEGTGTWCGWCPRGTVNMDLIAETYKDVVMPVAIHNFDPMAITEYDGPFSNTISGYPSGHVDRKDVDIDPQTFATALVGLQDRMVPVHVTTETVYDTASRMVNIKGTAFSTIPTQANELRFTCVITENNVSGTSPEWNQVNYYAGGANGVMGGFEELSDPVPAAQMVYHYVARAILGGFTGLENSISDVLEPNEDFTVELNYQVPTEYDVTQMKVIIFIQDEETGEVLNGDIVLLDGSTSVEQLVPAGKSSIYPNPATDILNLTIDYQTDAPVSMKLYTTYGGLVRDLGIINLNDGQAFEKINVADLQAGMYLLELRHKNSVTALPFTKL